MKPNFFYFLVVFSLLGMVMVLAAGTSPKHEPERFLTLFAIWYIQYSWPAVFLAYLPREILLAFRYGLKELNQTSSKVNLTNKEQIAEWRVLAYLILLIINFILVVSYGVLPLFAAAAHILNTIYWDKRWKEAILHDEEISLTPRIEKEIGKILEKKRF